MLAKYRTLYYLIRMAINAITQEQVMKLSEIAKAYGITVSGVKKWSPERRAAAVALLESGANPHVAEAIGKLASACYAASMRTGKSIWFNPTMTPLTKVFSVMAHDRVKRECDYIVETIELSLVALMGAIQAVEAL